METLEEHDPAGDLMGWYHDSYRYTDTLYYTAGYHVHSSAARSIAALQLQSPWMDCVHGLGLVWNFTWSSCEHADMIAYSGCVMLRSHPGCFYCTSTRCS